MWRGTLHSGSTAKVLPTAATTPNIIAKIGKKHHGKTTPQNIAHTCVRDRWNLTLGGTFTHTQQAWTLTEGLEGPPRVPSRGAGILMGGGQAGRAALQDRAILVLMMEAAAARRKRVLLPGPAGWGWGGWVQAKVGGGMRTPMEMQCCSPQYRWNHKRHRQEGCSHQHKAHHRNPICPGILLCCCTDGHGSDDEGHHKTAITGSLNSGQGCMGWMAAGGEGKRPRIGIS